MSQHEDARVGRSEAGEPDTTDRKHTYRLYPSLPTTNRYEHCVLTRTSRGTPHLPEDLPGNTQSEVPVPSIDTSMRAQILVLEEQKQELLSINDTWAREFRAMTQYYKDKLQDLKESLQAQPEVFEEGEQSFTPCTDKESAWDGVRDVTTQLLRAQKEVKELRSQNTILKRRWQHQGDEIRRLNKALEEALQMTPTPDVSSEPPQHIWKHQAEVYKEDFLKERKDRESLKSKYLELERKFVKVQSELRALKSQTRTRSPQPALECTCTHRAK